MIKKHKSIVIGDMVFRNNILSGSEIIFDYLIDFVNDDSLSESDIDSKTAGFLKKLGWNEEKEFRQQKTNIPEIDDYIKSKSIESKSKGKVDFYLLMDNKLKVLVDNKKPKESVEQGIDDAKYYADCLKQKGYDIRITMAYNGKDCLLRVYNSKENEWKPFYINGEELKAFPSKELVNLIYRYNDLEGVKITEDDPSISISIIINKLKEIYRNIPHIQNDNQKTIDFTISFLALKLILEKHSQELEKNWTDFKVSEQKKLKEKIKDAVEDIIDNLQNGYEEVFKIKEDKKGKIKSFDFLDAIKQFPNNTGDRKGNLVKIFETLDRLPHLHSSKFDIFSEIYQSLMDKHTRKIFGQFFTPRHLIKTLVRLFYDEEIPKIMNNVKEESSPKKICDPACGTGGFLTESFKYLATNLNDVDVISLAKKSIYGFDIYPSNAVRSRINMYLAGDGFSKIDSLNTLEYNEEKFDYILTNPPFGNGDFNVDKSIIPNKRKEVNFLIKAINLLKEDGKALIVVPDGVLESTNLSPLRNWLVKNCIIEKVIGLPKYIFAPYTHEKTYVLFLRKRNIPIENLEEIKSERIWMYIIDCDGYANSDRRFRTDKVDKHKKWIHDELSIWRNHKGAFHVSLLEECWKNKIQNENDKFTDEWGNNTEGLKYGYVPMENILSEKYTAFTIINTTQIMKILKENLDEEKPKKSKDLFENDKENDKKVLKENYQAFLTQMNIFYDKYKNKFYDESKPIVKNLIKLIPEKYLRKKEIEKITTNEFKKENKKLGIRIENKIGELLEIAKELKNES